MIALSGLSGAGKSTAAKALEDLGYFVVDNLPAELFLKLVELSEHTSAKKPLALVVDSREAEHLNQFIADWQISISKGAKMKLWFLDASDSTLIKRFQETRRPHPLDNSATGLADSIQQERKLLADVMTISDQIIRTDGYNSHELKSEICRLAGVSWQDTMDLRLMSFGFKHGIPQELDLCLDVRFLQNPYFIEALKQKTGLEEPVSSYVMSDPRAVQFAYRVTELLDFLIPCYEAEKKSYLTIAIGCTGGRHRSVALVEEIGQRLKNSGYELQISHRDIEK